ncbi:MAG: tripartite tricarboxylate transporter substrate binding protein [Betaproteobacteria bacterium]|nr:tripartite tricarboxylate transporter substrate binding protein [Betaproteobacteria bacterium]
MKKLLFSLLLCAVSGASAQSWPTKPVRIIVPFGPGALTDVAARALGIELSEQLGQQFLVENRGGAGGTLGTDLVAKSAPDGHTLAFTDNSFMISASLYRKLPYDPLKDLLAVTIAVEAPAIMVARLELPAKSLRDMIDLAKAKPRSLTFGSGGQGSSAHLATELFFNEAGAELMHVPYKGVAAALTEVVAGRIDVTISSIGAAVGHIKSGKVRPLAVSGKQRNNLLPEIPTFAESGYPDYDMVYRFGLLAPAGTPAAVISRLQQEIAKAAAKQKVRDFLATQGALPVATSTADYASTIEREIRMWKGVIDKTGVKVE